MNKKLIPIKVKPNYGGLLEDQEATVLDDVLNLRRQIVDKLTEDGIPTKVGEVRVLNEVLKGIEENIKFRADIRGKAEENENSRDIKELIKQIIVEGKPLDEIIDVEEVKTQIPEIKELSDVEVVEGEDSLETEKITLEELEEKFKN